MEAIGRYYWNTNGVAIAIVAVKGYANDWAAYIGATHEVEHEEDAIKWAKKHGAKLSESFAKSIFQFDDLMYRT